MKKHFLLFIILFGILLISCQKEPLKGNYEGTFEGSYTDTAENRIVHYTTKYYFEVVKSTNDEVHLKEKDSQMTSFLKKEANDSIVGKIGFGMVYNPIANGNSAINTISIRGKYHKENQKSYISGTFSTVISQYLSTGTFVLQHY